MPDPQVLLPPDVVGALIEWAPAALAARGVTGIAVAGELAGNDSVSIVRAGGVDALNGILDTPTVIVEAAAATLTRAENLLNWLRALIRSLAGGLIPGSTVWLHDYAEFAGPAHLPVPDSPNRHTMTLSLTTAARVL